MIHILDETKRTQHRGEGTGANYVPWIKPREINSSGTCVSLIDWKHGRLVQLLSQGEAMWYFHLRWDDSITDIREQFPLDVERTIRIASDLGYRHPQYLGNPTIMTTDMLVNRQNGTLEAYSIKPHGNLDDRTMEKEIIQKKYWNSKGIRYFLRTKDELNRREMCNLRAVLPFYDIAAVREGNRIDLIKHLIAVKEISVDLNSNFIDYQKIAEEYFGTKGKNHD